MPEPSCPLPTRAYNLELLHQEGGPGEQSHGWCFGQPPGILPEQWPLDPLTGYPLVHGFTLRLPRDYRCHGADETSADQRVRSVTRSTGVSDCVSISSDRGAGMVSPAGVMPLALRTSA